MLSSSKLLELQKYDGILTQAKTSAEYKIMRYKVYSEIESFAKQFYVEILQVVPEWNDLHKINDGMVCVHTVLVCYQTMKDPLFLAASPFEQNVLMWAALLHDIRKRGNPVF